MSDYGGLRRGPKKAKFIPTEEWKRTPEARIKLAMWFISQFDNHEQAKQYMGLAEELHLKALAINAVDEKKLVVTNPEPQNQERTSEAF